MTNAHITNYRSILTSELSARCMRNNRYSQAAFARDLGVSQSLLSEVLTGRHGLSRKKAESIAKHLGLNGRSTQLFCDSAEAHSSRSPTKRKLAKVRLKKAELTEAPISIRDEQLSMMEDWFYIAIIETLKLSPLGQEESVLAKRLRLQPAVG